MAIFCSYPNLVSTFKPLELRGKLKMDLASWGRNSEYIRSSIQQDLSSSITISAQTWVLIGIFLRGEMTRLKCTSGNHLLPRIKTDLPSPILHLEPNFTTRRAFMMLRQANDPFKFTSSSRTEKLGKYLALKTL